MGKNCFLALLRKAPSRGSKFLPLVHATKHTSFEKIFKSGNFDPSFCEDSTYKVFKKKLLCFFYGRNAYKVSEKLTELYFSMGKLPACFIIKTDYIDAIHAIYPFDTGGYNDGLYNEYLKKKYRIKDFLLGSKIENAMKFMELFYVNNRDYIDVYPHEVHSAYPIINEYSDLINAEQDEDGLFDERCSTIEVQVIHKVPVPASLEAIVIPERYQGKDYVKMIAGDPYNVEIILYKTPSSFSPTEYDSLVTEMVNNYYKEKNYI